MGVKVLVVDDDEIAGGLSTDLLKEAGFDAELLTDSLKAYAKVKAERPSLVLLDILMPGVDGLTLCNQITSDAELKDIRVAVLSGKAFAADKERARKYGATLFIEKPYSVDTFVAQIQSLMNIGKAAVSAKPLEAQALGNPDAVMDLTVWGCRSATIPGPSKYGVKSTCVTLKIGAHQLIFDAGSGLTAAGQGMTGNEAWLFMTHFHQDHQEGLPTFAPAARKGFKLHVAGARDPDKTLEQLVAAAFECAPATIASVEAEIDLYEMLEDTYDALPEVKISSFYANHPGTTLGFIVEHKGRKLVYSPDAEVYGETATAMQDYDERIGRIVHGADLLVHDGRYNSADYKTLRNHGHSSFASVIDMAARSEVKRLLLCHFDTQYSDADLDRMAAEAAQQCADKAYALQVAFAREGLTLGV